MPNANWERKHGEPLTAALDLAGRGWRVIPLHDVAAGPCSCGKADCGSPGKHPRTANGSKDGTTDAATIRCWWKRSPTANVAICTGKGSGVWMLGPDGEQGIEDLAELVRKYGGLPRTPTARSGSGGRHYFFRWPSEGMIGNQKKHRGTEIDFRGEGGYAVAAPSRNDKGGYVWEIPPDKCEPAEAPGWLVAWCRAKGEPKKGSAFTMRASSAPSIVDRAIAYLAKMPPAHSGQGGHDQTMEAARVVAWGFDLGEEVAYQILDQHYNPRCQPPWSEKELRHKCHDANTKDFDKPRGWLLKDDRPSAPAQGASVGSVGRNSSPQPPRKIPDYQPFPLSALPVVVREYVDASASAIGCDPALVAIPTLATVSGAIGNSRALLVKRKWIEPAIVWGITIGYSGERKSPAYDAAVNPFLEVQMDLIDEHEEAVARHNQDLLAWKEQDKDDRGEKPEPPDEPPCYVTSDATIECVGDLLARNPRGTLLARDELDAWFQSFTRYKGRAGGTDRPHWLELHRAGTLRIHRLTREQKSLSVRRACCSLTGTIQPAILARSLDDEAMAAGLGARFLLAMPPAKKRRWSEAEVSEELSGRYFELLGNLLALTLADDKKRKPHVLGMDSEAKRLWVDWYNAWGERMAASEGEQSAALAKLEAYAVRLALIHHVVSLAAIDVSDLRAVGARSLRAGIELVEWFAGEARRVYSILRESTEERDRRRLIDWIGQRGGHVAVRDLQRANSRRWPTREAAQAELESLVKLDLGTWETVAHAPSGGHDVQRFTLHPAPDTSDTRSQEEKSPSDTCSDTRPPDPKKHGEYERVSEVSGTHTSNGECQASKSKTECRARVSDEWEVPDDDSRTPFDRDPGEEE
jgi:hypothetical protein